MSKFVNGMFCVLFIAFVVGVGIGIYQSVVSSNSCRNVGGIVISDRGVFQHCISKGSLINLKGGI